MAHFGEEYEDYLKFSMKINEMLILEK